MSQTKDEIIIIDKDHKLYTTDIANTTKNITITAIEPGDYGCCIIAHNAELIIRIQSDVPDVHITIVCINYASRDKSVKCAIDAFTDHDRVAIDMTVLSLAGKGSHIDVQGGITMSQQVTDAKGYVLEETIILDPSARVTLLPKLDIHAHQVQASHAAKVHALQETELFYMQAKGLSLSTSKKLYIQGYLQNLFDKFPCMNQTFIEQQHQNISHALAL